MNEAEARQRLAALGLEPRAVDALAEHFVDAERRGKPGHGFARIEWLATLDLDPAARPVLVESEEGFERWDGHGALGYLVLDEIVRATLDDPPERARVVVARRCFPSGMLGHWVRRLAEGGLVAALTATSPRRLPHPDGGEPVTGTNPLAIAIPSSDGPPVVADVSMGAVTHGDVLAGRAPGRARSVRGRRRTRRSRRGPAARSALAGPEHGAVLVVARSDHDPVPAQAARRGRRLPGEAAAGLERSPGAVKSPGGERSVGACLGTSPRAHPPSHRRRGCPPCAAQRAPSGGPPSAAILARVRAPPALSTMPSASRLGAGPRRTCKR
jgi:hypothetical protein